MSGRHRRSKYAAYPAFVGFGLLLPALIVLATIRIYPLLDGAYLGLTNMSLLSSKGPQFIGLENIFRIVAKDTEFYQVLWFSLIYTFAVVVVSYLVGLMLAGLLNQDVPLQGLFRILILVPWVVPTVVAAANWLQLLNDQFGVVNHTLVALHIVKSPILFIADPKLARITVMVFSVWRALPFMTIVLLAGLQTIPRELYESARIDGASRIRCVLSITIPLLRNVTIICMVLMSIWTFNNFEDIYLLTGGGPVNATQVLPIFVYDTAFFSGQMGYAAAISDVMAVLLFLLTLPYVRREQNIYT